MALDMTAETEEKMLKLESTCLDKLQESVEAGETNDYVKQMKEMLAITAKNRQTLNARDAVRFQMVNSFASDKEKRRYVTATEPEIRKHLPEAAESPRGA